MSYEKPNLFVLGLGSVTVHGGSHSDSGSNTSQKATNTHEVGQPEGGNAETSSTGGAYEADE